MLHVLIILLLAILGRVDAAEQPPGVRIDIGGYKLYLRCLGQGRPAVILDAGLGGASRDWEQVQRGLASFTQTCFYDRAGYGRSDAGPLPRTSSRIAFELHSLLERAGIQPPYILAGHSFGGYNMRLYASRYPSETAALVLVDTPHEAQVDDFLRDQLMRQIDPTGLLPSLWPGLLDELAAMNIGPIADLLGLPAKTLRTMLGELSAFEKSGKELASYPLTPDLPLVIIMHGKRVLPSGPLGDRLEQRWLELQRELAARHRNSAFLIAKNSAHLIPVEQPELIIEAIQRLVTAQRLQGLASLSAQ